MKNALLRCLAFLRRDFQSEVSYRFYFLLQLSGLAWMLTAVWFGSKLIPTDSPVLARYGGNYFVFLLLGYVSLEYLRVAVWGFSSRIREAQNLGTIEALLVTPVGIPTVLFGSVIYPFVWATMRAIGFLAIAGVVSGKLGEANWSALAATLLLAMVVFGSMGILSASFIMVFKKGDPISGLLFGGSTLFAGLLFPVELLGEYEWISKIIPLTYSMEAIRRATLGAGWDELRPHVMMLALFAAVLLPVAVWGFRYAVERARRDGTLAHY
jgi:ABC-2 type transport system permease protein